MSGISKPKAYRDIIDALVRMCREGQGQLGGRAVRGWNPNQNPVAEGTSEDDDGGLPPEVVAAVHKMREEQQEEYALLERLSVDDREILARMLEQEVVTGVFETLKVLEQHGVPPFEYGYEGNPFNDFVGRLDDWEWPES